MDYQSLFTFILEMAGTIAFAASGAMVGAQRGMDIFGICVLGVVTAVGGGATRDIILGIVPPYIFVRHIYACASIVGAIACVWVYRLWGGVPAMVIGTVVVILIRYLAAHYRWNLPRLRRE